MVPLAPLVRFVECVCRTRAVSAKQTFFITQRVVLPICFPICFAQVLYKDRSAGIPTSTGNDRPQNISDPDLVRGKRFNHLACGFQLA